MHKGIYIALSGALMKQLDLELVFENIANAQTPGFKRGGLSFRDYLINTSYEQIDSRTMTYVSGMRLDMTSGSLLKTGNKLDIAIEGRGFISIEGGLYTRRGDLMKTREGYLVHSSGKRVLGINGPLRLPDGEVEIREDGSIYVNGGFVERLRIVEFDASDSLKRVAEGLYQSNAPTKSSTSKVLQGYIEESNVEIVREMVRLISNLREFETFQKAIQTLDEAAGKVNNEMARI